MSLFAGIYAIGNRKPIAETAIMRIKQTIAPSGDQIETFTTPYFFLVKYDFGAFGEPGYVMDKENGVAAIAGEPILQFGNEESYSRLTDLSTLSEQLSQGHVDVLRACHGTYAICCYHASKHALILATDKLGARPVYYYFDDDFVYFSNSLKILERVEAIPKRFDLKAFVEQFVFGVPLGTKTLYADIKVLRDGEYLIAGAENPRIASYFRWDQIPVTPKSLDAILSECYTAFTTAVRSRSQRNHEAFSFLSGGLDSRCVVSILKSLGKEVMALNCSRPGEQDSLFAEQYAKQIGIQYVAAERPRDVTTTVRLFEEAIKTTSHEMQQRPYPRLIFSGDGGSVGVGFVYLDETLFDLLNAHQVDQACHYFLKKWSTIPQNMITSAAWQTMQHIPFDGIKAEFDDVTVVEPEHAAFLFLLRNDQRRHLHGYYEQIDQHKVELLIPFYDARLLQIIVSASTLTPFLYHNFYHQWLQLFPEQTTMIPWQTYPGHLPCPVPKKEEILSQWQMYHDDKFRISQRWMKSCWSILGKRDFPRHIIRRPVVLLAILLHKLKIRNYAYIFKFCINLYEHISKCQPSE